MTAGREIPIYIGMVKNDGGGEGDSDLHRNGRNWKLGKKNLPFRRTPESLREIPIYIGMVEIENVGRGGNAGMESA